MKVSIGMKIGGGFGVLLVLICILGGMMQMALDDSLDTSVTIASDRFPRYASNNTLQSNLLLAGYRVRIFFSEMDEEALAGYKDYVEQAKASLAQLEKVNREYPAPRTTRFLEEYGQSFARF